MKHNQMKNEMQQTRNIKDVYTEKEHHVLNLKTHRMNSSIAPTCETGKRRAIEHTDNLNIFLVQNKGKGPPGRQRSPVGIKPNRFHKPVRFDQTNDIISDPHSLPSNFGLRNFHPSDFETITNKKNDDYIFYKFNFLQLLNSIFMKKQLFILILAVFASVTVAFGQATHNTASQAVTCTNDALNPIAGKEYTYSADITPANGTAFWHVVYNQTNFITTGTWAATDEVVSTGSFISSATGLGSNANAASPSLAKIVWKSEGLATVVPGTKPLFVAVDYTGPATGCTNNNLQVWEIKPKNAFTLDIYPMKPDYSSTITDGSVVAQCYDKVQGAQYNAGAVKMDYGTNTMYFEVIAANFTTSFNSQYRITGLKTGQTADVFWGYTAAAATTSLGSLSADGVVNATAINATTNATDTSTGVSIYIKVVVKNNGYEGISSDVIKLAVDGTNSAGQDDVKISDCSNETAYADEASQTLNARPTINNPTPTPFLNKN